MTSATTLSDAPDLTGDDYIVIGLAHCFIKEDGEVQPVTIAEPIPSAALEAIIKGIPTSYQIASAVTLGTLLTDESVTLPEAFNPETQLCDDFRERTIAAARTYKRREVAKSHISVGTTFEKLNFSTERKRLLNSERIVSAEDNVKQHAYTHQVL
ncbi:hypothetical protein AB3M80_04605 [Arthrospira platensis BEA 1257B]